MRLLKICEDGTFSLTPDLLGDTRIPAYAILSHTWEAGEEVTFDDMNNDAQKDKNGWKKIAFCAQQALRDGLLYCWVDTCCINKADVTELQDAINSMFRWYKEAAKCYVYLADVSKPTDTTQTIGWLDAFRTSRWHTRGWTCQELIAPSAVSFYSCEWGYLGDRKDLRQELHDITGIPIAALSGASLGNFGVEQKLSWSKDRNTTRKEDKAYCLLGMFDVFIPLLYGEGEERAFKRLKEEIDKSCPGGPSKFSQTVPRTYYSLPFSRNRYFVGRTDEMKELERRLVVDRDCGKLAIVGLGGTGKTQLALKFAYLVKETMPAVSIFWLPALSMSGYEQSCASIVKDLGLSSGKSSDMDAKTLLQQHLSSDHVGYWLFILDNADDHDLVFGRDQSPGMNDYMPENERGVMLFTTRVQDIAVSLARGNVLELGPMNQEDALGFLKKSLAKKDLLKDNEGTTRLLKELVYLPLAIAQAAAYINMNKITIARYLERLGNTDERSIQFLSKEFRDQTRYSGSSNAVGKTWMLSFAQMLEREKAAADMLAFIACVEWRAIPYSLLPEPGEGEQKEDAVDVLCRYSFLTRQEQASKHIGKEGAPEDWYDMHRLVHLAAQQWLRQKQSLASTTNDALKRVAFVFPWRDYENRFIWRAFMPHALRILQSEQQCNNEDRAKLSLFVGNCLDADGRVRDALTWLEESHRLRVHLEEGNSDRLASEHALALAYHRNGQYDRALPLLEHVTSVQAKLLAEDDRNRLASEHALATVYLFSGQVKQAIDRFERNVAVQKKTLADGDQLRLNYQRLLASAFSHDGQVRKAIMLLEHVVAIEGKSLAEDHPGRLASQHELAKAYLKNRQVRKTVPLLKHVVTVQKALAEDHPNRLASQLELAHAYHTNGQVTEAIALMEQVVNVQARCLRDDHPDRLNSENWLRSWQQQDGGG